MKLKAKITNLSTGGPFVVILNIANANLLNLNPLDRINLKLNDKKATAIVDIDIESKHIKKGEIGIFHELAKKFNIKTNTEIKINRAIKPNSILYIKDKLDGKTLTKEQINEIIKDINENNLTEAEIAYFVSGCYEHELDSNEIVYFTEAIIKDLERLDLREKTIADKHCIGGLAGNRTTPIVVPIIAASGITIPNTSTRSITSAAGTTDVLEMLLPISHSKKEIKDILKITKACLVWDGNLNLHSAENKIIKIEKPVSLDCEGIMIASILAKKAALNATHILIDIPIGEETKMSSIKKSKHLKKKFIKLGKKLHMKVKVIITNGSQPIGNGIGPGLEARDVLLVLQNKGPKDLKEKSIKLAESLLKLCNKPKRLARQILESGEAYKKMQEIIKAQGGNPNIQPENIKLSKYKKTFYSQKKGKITKVSNHLTAKYAKLAGAPSEKGSGIYLYKHLKEKVKENEPLFDVYSEDREQIKLISKLNKKEPIYGLN